VAQPRRLGEAVDGSDMRQKRKLRRLQELDSERAGEGPRTLDAIGGIQSPQAQALRPVLSPWVEFDHFQPPAKACLLPNGVRARSYLAVGVRTTSRLSHCIRN
jgi:hypothetical protein